MQFFEGVVQKLVLYERQVNPAAKAEIKSADKGDDEEFMKKTADYNEPEPDSPKRVRINSFSKEDDELDIQVSTSRPRQLSSPNKVKQFKKMTEDVSNGLPQELREVELDISKSDIRKAGYIDLRRLRAKNKSFFDEDSSIANDHLYSLNDPTLSGDRPMGSSSTQGERGRQRKTTQK